MEIEEIYRERPERGKLVGVYMDEDLAVRSLEWARKNYMSRSKLIRCLLAEFLEEQGDEQESNQYDLPETLIDQIDAQVEETGAKSRSSLVTELIQQSLSGQTIALTDEEYQALLIYSEAVQMSPGDVIKFVLDNLVGVGQQVKERLENEV